MHIFLSKNIQKISVICTSTTQPILNKWEWAKRANRREVFGMSISLTIIILDSYCSTSTSIIFLYEYNKLLFDHIVDSQNYHRGTRRLICKRSKANVWFCNFFVREDDRDWGVGRSFVVTSGRHSKSHQIRCPTLRELKQTQFSAEYLQF